MFYYETAYGVNDSIKLNAVASAKHMLGDYTVRSYKIEQIDKNKLKGRHRAGVSPYTSPFGFAETCVFDKQSPGPFHCGLLSQAPLLPKLRGQYAEFLNNPSPGGLRILSSSTCVGLRYGRLHHTYAFSRRLLHSLPYSISVPYARRNQRPG